MANHQSAKKRHRQNLKRRARNRYARSSIRTEVKKSLEAAQNGDFETARNAAKKATSLLDKAVVHGLYHKNNVKRRISRLYNKIASSEGTA